MSTVTENLKLLAIFHYVVAGIAALFSMFPVIHLVIGFTLLAAPETMVKPGATAAADLHLLHFVGAAFFILAAIFILCGLSFAACVAVSGWFLQKRTRYLYCMVMAGIECAFVPFGTVLGVFTIITLVKPETQQLFGRTPNHSATAATGPSPPS
jgi:hypothetical protein